MIVFFLPIKTGMVSSPISLSECIHPIASIDVLVITSIKTNSPHTKVISLRVAIKVIDGRMMTAKVQAAAIKISFDPGISRRLLKRKFHVVGIT